MCELLPDVEEDQPVLSRIPHAHEEDPEFNSGPMPAAFPACLFLGLAIVGMFGLLAVLW